MGRILWIVCAIGAAVVARNKGRNAILWFIFGVFGGYVTLLIVCLLPSARNRQISQGEARKPSEGAFPNGWPGSASQPQASAARASGQPAAASMSQSAAPEENLSQEPEQTCPNCGHLNDADAIFCENCGRRLRFKFSLDKKSDKMFESKTRCSKCGQLVEKGSQFCPNCGNKIKSAR